MCSGDLNVPKVLFYYIIYLNIILFDNYSGYQQRQLSQNKVHFNRIFKGM